MTSQHTLTLFDFFRRNAMLNKAGCAVHFNGEDTSFSALYDQTLKLIAGLSGLALSPGARVAVLAKNHPAFFHLFGAASALNLCLVLINRRLSPEEVAYIVEDTTPQIIVCDPDMAELGQTLTNNAPSLNACFVLGDNFSDLYTPAVEEIHPAADTKSPYVIIHTAAVQGKPRGAVLSQENIILSNLQLNHNFGLDTDAAYLNILPLFHIMGVNFGLGTFMAGGKNIIQEKFSPTQALDLIQEQKVTIFGSFPPILTTLLDAIEKADAGKARLDLSSLKIAAGLEVPDTVKRWEAATPAKFWTMYGQTETSGLITFSKYFEQPGSAGVISPLANIAVADDMDNLLPAGSTGEILVKGPLVFQGYWQADDLNAFTFRQGWHHTGDLGMIDENGFLFFKGRKAEKELIKPGGENVFPAEVEKAILAHAAVAAACVIGVPDPKFGEGIKAVCTLAKGADLTKEELIAHTGTLIAGYKKPRYVEFVDTLPLSEDGAVDRAKVKALYGN
ncbi:MAG TPA: long-chain fatty acid--CoA ligase [Desulfobacteraceae bacterium]|nr:long-chain fatty acid--CoA ligase [Desulfobacteraceae bacterium]